MFHFTQEQLNEAADDLRNDIEVGCISHGRKVELAQEYLHEIAGEAPRKSAVLLVVKLANLNWEAAKIATKKLINNL